MEDDANILERAIPFWTLDERAAWEETEAWLHVEASRFSKMMGLTRKPIEYAYSKVPESVRESIASAILSVLRTVRDGTTDLVSAQAVMDRLPSVPSGEHGIFQLGVRAVDDVARTLIGQSKNACMAEGAATGLAGLPGIVVDVPALYSLLFRMMAQVAICYGFPPDIEDERSHLLKVLDVGHLQEPAARKQGMQELAQLQEMIGSSVPAAEAQRFAVEKGLQNLARHLGLALTQRKLAQTVAIVGGVVGAGVNRQLAGEVGEVAFHAYRRRYLLEVARLRRAGSFPGRSVSAPSPPASCARCFTPLPPGVRFCPTCGHSASTSPASTVEPVTLVESPSTVEAPSTVEPISTLEPAALATPVVPVTEPQPRHTDMLGNVRLEIDADEANLLLEELTGGGAVKVAYEAGQVVVERGGLSAVMTHLSLQGTAVSLQSPVGRWHLELAHLDPRPEGLSLELRVGME